MNSIKEKEEEELFDEDEVELDDDIDIPEEEEEELDAVPDLFLKDALVEEEDLDDESLEFDLFDDIDE